MLRFFGLSLAVLLAVAATLSSLLYLGTPLGPLHGLVERSISDALGRRVDFGEDLELQIGSEIRLRLGRTTLGNAPWASNPIMATLEHAELVLDARSLWDEGPVIIKLLAVEGLSASFERDADGQSNLPLMDDQSGDETDSDDGAPEPATPFLLTATSLKNIRLIRRPRPATPELDLRIVELDQRLVSDGMTITGNGQFQERPWSLSATGADLESHLRGENLYADFTVALDELRLRGNYRLPQIRELEDLSLNATLRGPLPPRLAAISPVFDAGEPMLVDIEVVDIDPGIRINVHADLAQLDFTAVGDIDRPGDGDGAELTVSVDAASLPRLAAALDLGESDEVPLNVKAAFSREGRRISLRDIDVRAGEQSITGSVLIPAFPGTDDAQVDLAIAGPDFSFIQRLLRRPPTLPYPYTVNAQVAADERQAERVDMRLSIGEITATVTGSLSEYPHYANSDVELAVAGPNLGAVLAHADIDFPDQSFSIRGGIDVDDDGVIRIREFRAASAGIQIAADGLLNGHPSFDGLQIDASATIPSLAYSSEVFGVESLGEAAASFSVQANGNLKALQIGNVALSAGRSSLRSSAGSVSIDDGGIRSDLRLEGFVSELPEILGNYSTPAMAAEDYRFDVVTRLDDEVVEFKLEDLEGPGIRGEARLSLPADLKLDARAILEADVQVMSPQSFLPDLSPYQPPAGPLWVYADTRGGRSQRQIDLQLRGADEALVSGNLLLPSTDMNEIVLTVDGSGDDIRVFGDSDLLPDGPLPYKVNLSLTRDGSQLNVDARSIEVAGTSILGRVRFDPAFADLAAELQIPQGNLQLWLDHFNADSGDPATQETALTKDVYLIPDSPLPLDALNALNLDIELKTGDLGLRDPGFPDESLVDALEMTVRTSADSQHLEIHKLSGSRGQMNGVFNLSPDGEGEAVLMEADLHVVDLPIGITSRGKSLDVLPRNQIDASFTARGATYRNLAASLSGELLMVGGSGTLDDVGLSFATESFIAQLFETLLPALSTDSPDMKVQCTVLAMQAVDGIIDLNPGFVFRTDRVDLSARGNLNLRNEKIAIRFDNQARKGFGISAASLVNPYVQITGRLAKPTLGLDVKNSAIAGGAAVATGGLTVLAKPLFGRFLRRGDPCKTALDRWSELTAAPQTPSPGA